MEENKKFSSQEKNSAFVLGWCKGSINWEKMGRELEIKVPR